MIALSTRNQVMDGNIKFAYTVKDEIPAYFYGFIPHSYPSFEDFLKGVKTDLFWAERESPNAKIIQQNIREKANQMIKEKELYEVLLVNSDGLITEGSRSNVFFVKGNRFYTAPVYQVLVGVTRQKVLECLSELAFPIIEEAVFSLEISAYDAVFLTGTSPNVLPVNCIGTSTFQTNNFFVEKLMAKYNLMVETYIRSQKT